MLGHNNSTPPVRQDARTPDWALPGVQEFVPGKLDPSALVSCVCFLSESLAERRDVEALS